MSDKDNDTSYYSDLAEQPAEREIVINGKAKTVFFRRITSGERIKCNEGVNFKRLADGKMEGTIDFAEHLKRQQKLVAFSNVKADGTKVFRNPEKVADLDSAIFDQLLKHAEEVNAEDAKVGKG